MFDFFDDEFNESSAVAGAPDGPVMDPKTGRLSTETEDSDCVDEFDEVLKELINTLK